MDGIIITSIGETTPKLKGLMAEGKIVLCNRYLGNEDLDIIRIDEEKACYEGTKFLIDKGHKVIAFCTGNHRKPSLNDKRYRGFLKALDKAGLHFDDKHYFRNTMGIEGGKDFVKSWLKIKQNRPTAVFSNGDLTAAGIINEVQANGLSVPKDLAVLGFDDQPIEEMGQLATEILIASLEGAEIPKYKVLETQLILRESV